MYHLYLHTYPHTLQSKDHKCTIKQHLNRAQNLFEKFRQIKFTLKSRSLPCSVTGFGEISPLWQNFKTLWAIFWKVFSIWQTLETALEFYASAAYFHLL